MVVLKGHTQVDKPAVNSSVPSYTALAPAHIMPYISLARCRNYTEFHQDLVIFGVVCFQGCVWGSERATRLSARLACLRDSLVIYVMDFSNIIVKVEAHCKQKYERGKMSSPRPTSSVCSDSFELDELLETLSGHL